MHSPIRSNSRLGMALIAVAIAAVCACASAPTAFAAFGDDFDFLAINGPGGIGAPAFPGSKAGWAGTCDLAHPDVAAGVLPAYTPVDCLDAGVAQESSTAAGSNPSPWTQVPTWRLGPVAQAGAHPDATVAFYFKRGIPGVGSQLTDGLVKDTIVAAPPGASGDPTATPVCPAEQARRVVPACPPNSQVGLASVLSSNALFNYERRPVYNMESRDGKTAEFLIPAMGGSTTNVPLVAKLRSDGDFGVSALGERIPAAAPVHGTIVTLWGVPWDPIHDIWRPATPQAYVSFPSDGLGIGIPARGLANADRASYDPSWGPIKPFFSNPTSCDGTEPVTSIVASHWEDPASWTASGLPDLDDPRWLKVDSPAPATTGCDKLPFEPTVAVQPTSLAADSAAGLGAEIDVPQNDEPPTGIARDADPVAGAPAFWRSDAGLATSHLKDTEVLLPEGVAINPSTAAGLQACTDEQIGVKGFDADAGRPLFDNEDPFDSKGDDCPAGSRIGSVEAVTPVLEEQLTGEVVLGQPKSTDPQSGEMFRLFLVLRNAERGLLVKIFGSAVADPVTGRLKATFANNPQVPVEKIAVELKGGPRGVLAMPQSCGERSTTSTLTPWSAVNAGGGPVRELTDSFTVGGDCSHGFAPGLEAGMSVDRARASGAFSFRFSREDGEQWVAGLTASLPPGLLASVRGVPLCSSSDAETGNCPVASRIGTVDAAAGSGSPFVLERKGDAYLTQGYKGCPYGLAVKVPVVAGPFDGASPATDLGSIVVRQKVCVDAATAQVTAVSDPLPTIWHGIPLRVRSVTVSIDRPEFMINPSDCALKQIAAELVSVEGASLGVSNPFQVSGCGALSFKPKLALRLTGRRQVTTGTHPAVRAVVTQEGVGEAGIEKAVVRLPKSLALDPDNAQALCEFVDGTKPDLEKHCPAGSIVGRARAKTPLLNNDLVGNVYFVKNVRKDPVTGNLIRTLPMLVVALRGEIAINLKGESSTTKGGKLVNTFASVPDAPISQFNLNIKGGPNGILAVTRTRKSRINLCAARQIAEADTDGQNGRRRDFDIRIKTPCTKAQTKAAKRRAKM